MQAIALLKAAISLLLAIQALGPLASDDLKAQANALANAAIASATYQIEHPDMTDTDDNTSGGSSSNGGGSEPAPSGNGAPATPDETQGPASIEIVATNSSQELGDTFATSTEPSLESTAILGAIVRDANGNVLRDVDVRIEAPGTDKVLHGTGNLWGAPHNVYYYPFSYTFTEAGEHVITFTAGDVSESVTLKAE